MPMPQEFSDYRSKLQSQIQDEYGRVVYTYTCHHKIADRLSGRNSKLKVYKSANPGLGRWLVFYSTVGLE